MKPIEKLQGLIKAVKSQNDFNPIFLENGVFIHGMFDGKCTLFYCDEIDIMDDGIVTFSTFRDEYHNEEDYIGTSSLDPYLTDEDINKIILAI